MEIVVEKAAEGGLFGGNCVGDKQVVWMSHGDEEARLPDGMRWWHVAFGGMLLLSRIAGGGSLVFSITMRYMETNIFGAVRSDTKVEEREFIISTKLLMRQLLELDCIEAEGEAMLQRKN